MQLDNYTDANQRAFNKPLGWLVALVTVAFGMSIIFALKRGIEACQTFATFSCGTRWWVLAFLLAVGIVVTWLTSGALRHLIAMSDEY